MDRTKRDTRAGSFEAGGAHPDLFSQPTPPRARTSHPETSKAAAASVRKQTASHRRILALFKLYGDMTDETLATYLNEAQQATGMKPMSPSGIRSRRSELAKPNMDRLDEIAWEYAGQPFSRLGCSFADMDEAAQKRARHQLRTEGFRSPLWDTGKRETMSTGRAAIVWGIAR
jgi:hypothetical protein